MLGVTHCQVDTVKCNGQDFHEMHSRLCSSNNLLTLNQIDRALFPFMGR